MLAYFNAVMPELEPWNTLKSLGLENTVNHRLQSIVLILCVSAHATWYDLLTPLCLCSEPICVVNFGFGLLIRYNISMLYLAGIRWPTIRCLELGDPRIRGAVNVWWRKWRFVHVSQVVRHGRAGRPYARFFHAVPHRKTDTYTLAHIHGKIRDS